MRKYAAFFFAGVSLLTSIAAEPAYAQTLTRDSEAQLRRQLDEVLAREAQSKIQIEILERRLQALEAAVLPTGTNRLSEQQEEAIRGRGAATGLATQTQPDGSVTIVPRAIGDAPAASVQDAANEQETRKAPAPAEAVEIVTEREQGIFRDKLSVEFGLTYTHFDSAALNLSGFLALDSIFLGKISLDQIVSDVFVSDWTLRYGLTKRLQIDGNVPFLYRHSNFSSGGAGGSAAGLAETDITERGIGDVNFGVSYRVVPESLLWPDIVVNARAKAPTGRHPWGVELVEVPGTLGNLKVPARLPTGSGVWSASAGISLLKTVDPMVVFGSVTYFYNFKTHFNDLEEADFDQPGKVKIGDAIQFGAGVAYALNDRSSLNMSFTERVVQRTKLFRDCAGCGTETIVSSQANVGIVNLGANFSLNERAALITTIGMGVTQDAPDMTLSIRVPYRF
jgi:hypothetical protein